MPENTQCSSRDELNHMQGVLVSWAWSALELSGTAGHARVTTGLHQNQSQEFSFVWHC